MLVQSKKPKQNGRRRPSRVQTAGARAASRPSVSEKRSVRAQPQLTRAERQALTRRRLFDAAASIVGRRGYADASIQEITRQAGVALGTFYNYFKSRQDLLDQLLPTIGEEMYAHVRSRAAEVSEPVAREEMRFRAFFEFLQMRPEFFRILHEAEQFAPDGFRRHIANISSGYVRALERATVRGDIEGYSPFELEVVVHILMAARDYIGMRYCLSRGRVQAIPNDVVKAYMRLLTKGLFNKR
jgi:AcrR family transcriptional regulator